MQTSYRKQEPPFCIQVELTEGCNLGCTFCGINGIRNKAGGPFKFMTTETAALLARQIGELGWNSRLEFAMHGEPTMNPEWISILNIFRTHLRKHSMMMTSNGGGLLKTPGPSHWLKQAFKYLDTFALDNYESYKIGAKVLENVLIPPGVVMMHYPSGGPKASPHRRRNVHKELRLFTVIQDISRATAGTHATLNNHAGSAGPLNDKAATSRCAKPFREISVRWDGSIALCCNDWRGVYKLGNIHEINMGEIWQGQEINAARCYLGRGERAFTPCKGCDAISYRPGLLPDPKGTAELAPINADHTSWILHALYGDSYSPAVKRPWEA